MSVISLISKPTLPNKRACPTSITMGMFSLTGFGHPTHRGPCRRTGIVYNVTPGAVGVIVHKIVGNRYIEKRVNIRIEHVRHSKCRQEFLDRVKSNTEAHSAAKEKGGECRIFVLVTCGGGSYSFACTERVDLKRKPTLPRESHVVSIVDNAPQTMRPVPYETTI